MENGVVIEEGTHQDLLASSGKYANMWALQESQGPPPVDYSSTSDSESGDFVIIDSDKEMSDEEETQAMAGK